MGLLDKAKGLVAGHKKEVASAIDKVADVAEQKAPAQADKIDDVAEKAKDALDKLD